MIDQFLNVLENADQNAASIHYIFLIAPECSHSIANEPLDPA